MSVVRGKQVFCVKLLSGFITLHIKFTFATPTSLLKMCDLYKFTYKTPQTFFIFIHFANLLFGFNVLKY